MGHRDDRSTALADAAGHILAAAVHAAVELGIADRLKDAPCAAASLAAEIGADPEALYRLLHFLAGRGYFEETEGRRFALTGLGGMLRADSQGSTHAVLRSLARSGMWSAFGALTEIVRTGTAPSAARADRYGEFGGGPDEDALGEAMIGYHSGGPEELLAGYDFSSSRAIVDVGGSTGHLFTLLLDRYPAAHGIVFDRPAAVAADGERHSARGLPPRCRFVGGSFFDSVPGGGDTYILSRVLHDWSDAAAGRILDSCRRAMAPGSKLLIVEPLRFADGRNERSLPFDLLLLAHCEGRLRSFEEYRALLETAGFGEPRLALVGRQASVVEAVR